jgi:hypothetical protein
MCWLASSYISAVLILQRFVDPVGSNAGKTGLTAAALAPRWRQCVQEHIKRTAGRTNGTVCCINIKHGMDLAVEQKLRALVSLHGTADIMGA